MPCGTCIVPANNLSTKQCVLPHRNALTYISSPRALKQALCTGLGDEFRTLFDTPIKLKQMRWRTFQKYLDRDAELEVRELPYLFRLLGRMKG